MAKLALAGWRFVHTDEPPLGGVSYWFAYTPWNEIVGRGHTLLTLLEGVEHRKNPFEEGLDMTSATAGAREETGAPKP